MEEADKHDLSQVIKVNNGDVKLHPWYDVIKITLLLWSSSPKPMTPV